MPAFNTFNGLQLSKTSMPDQSVVVSSNKELDILKMIDQIAQESIADIARSFYTNGVMIESAANTNLRRIEGRMQSLKSLIQSVK